MKRVKNVRDTIYLMLYSEPRYPLEVSKLIYGQANNRVFAEIKQLHKDKWIEEFTVSIDVPDKRAEKRKYYRASIEPIIKHIKETYLYPPDGDLAVGFNAMFREILNSRSFRYWVGNKLPEDFEVVAIDGIDFILTLLDGLFIMNEQNKFFKKQFGEIKDSQSYYKAIAFLRKDSKFQSKLPEIANILYGDEEIPELVEKDLVYMFVLPSISDIRPMGFSRFGEIYTWSISFSQNISKLF